MTVPLPQYTGADTRLDDDRGQGLAVLVSAVVGAAIWAVCWAWDAPFTYAGDVGMFGGPYGAVRFVGCVVAIPVAGVAMGCWTWPWAGAAGLTAGFGVVWSADAFITYSNPFWLLGVVPMWLLVAAGAFVGAWLGGRARARGHR